MLMQTLQCDALNLISLSVSSHFCIVLQRATLREVTNTVRARCVVADKLRAQRLGDLCASFAPAFYAMILSALKGCSAREQHACTCHMSSTRQSYQHRR